MILESIRGLFGLKRKGDEKELIINCERLENRVALLEGGRLEEFSIERTSDKQISGSIYKGIVRNLEPGLKAMFVDIGLDKNAFLHYWDALPAAPDSSVETVQREGAGKRPRKKKLTAADIPKLYPPGSEIVVQVTKGPIGTKGPRITTNISMPGRYLVLMPYSDQCGISRKIDDPKERQRLRTILNGLHLPDGMGVIIRTVGEGQKARYFVRDLHMLIDQWTRIEHKMETDKAPALLLPEPDLIERTVRDFLTDDVDRIVVDNPDESERIRDLVSPISKRSASKIKYYSEATPIFERFQIERQIDSAFRRQVWLESGGYLVIDETEAMVTIDINTGRHKGPKGKQDKTILHTNLEAAEEVARQLRLRNVGGLVVIDFIDMKASRDRQAVVSKLRECCYRDKAKTHILPISQLGLVEMTRQRVAESISRAVYTECPLCRGKGVIKSAESMSVEIQRAITRVMRLYPDIHELRIVVNREVLDRLKAHDEDILIDLERRFQGRLSFRVNANFHFEEFELINAATNKPLE